MKVYHPEGSNMMLMVTPGTDDPVCSDWKDGKGNPKRFDIQFRQGVAEVPNNLGAWLIKHGLANKTGLSVMRRRLLRA